MLAYSFALTLALAASSPWWLWRLATTKRYREGLRQRLGAVPVALRAFAKNKRVVWVHAVSVGEVLAATRLVSKLETALGEGWRVVISTTTKTGQALARERFGPERVFYFPLDFAFAVRAYLKALQPKLLILMESELWPRMLHECARAGVPVAVANARVSDRSFARGMKFRSIWQWMARPVSLWLAQSDEDARRLTALGADATHVSTAGNLKYDVRAPKQSRIAELIVEAAAGRPIVVAGSTVENEDTLIQAAFVNIWAAVPSCLFVIAPRHPERFKQVLEGGENFGAVFATDLTDRNAKTILHQTSRPEGTGRVWESKTLTIVLNTIGDLAAIYGIATVAIVGGSFVRRGGHNPLEPTQFGVPVVMGPSYENFLGIVTALKQANGICIVHDGQPTLSLTNLEEIFETQDEIGSLCESLSSTVIALMKDGKLRTTVGERGRQVFEAQQGATARSVAALVGLVAKRPPTTTPEVRR